jgi:hypothetical protein
MKTSLQFRVAFIALVCLAFVAFIGKSYESSIRGIDSNIHSKVSMDVTSNGFLPKLPIPDPNAGSKISSSYFNDHPFFFFWVNGTVMRALQPSAWSARLLTAGFSTGCVIMTFLLGAIWHSPLFGFITALFFLFSRDVILTGATVSLDPAMMFFILLSFYCWQKKKWFLTSLSCGIGLWIKTPVVLLVYPTAIFVSAFRGELSHELKKILRSVLFAILIGSLVWIATGLLGNWHLVTDYWIRQLWGTAVEGRKTGQGSDFTMFFRFVKNGFLPGLPFLIFSLGIIARKRLWRQPPVLISLTAVGVLFFAITPMKFKMDYYFNPAFPFLAILATYSVMGLLQTFEDRFYSIVSGGALLLISFLLCTPTSLGPEAFVALKRFIPYIQTYGTCEDDIILVPGGEPVGSAHDYVLALNFYTGRRVVVTGCELVQTVIRKNEPRWLFLSRENYERCLTQVEQAKFKARFKLGSQMLLSTLDIDTTDLTPLERELKPVIDCKAPPYPQDRYHSYD